MVGGQWDPRTHDLRDALAVNGVPFEFHAQDSDVGRQLIQDHQVDLTRLPAVITYDGTVLHQPSMTDLAAHHGIQTRPGTPTIRPGRARRRTGGSCRGRLRRL